MDILRGLSEVRVLCGDVVCSEEQSRILYEIKTAAIRWAAFEQLAIDASGQLTSTEICFSRDSVAQSSNAKGIRECNAEDESDNPGRIILAQARASVGRLIALSKEIKRPVQLPDGETSYDPALRLGERLAIMDKMFGLMETLIDLTGASEKTVVVRDVRKLRVAARFAKELMKGDEATYMAAVFAFANSQNSVSIPDSVKHVVPIVVEIAHAETSKDVAGVIEKAAAPIGSYREKSKRSLYMVTAMLGLARGEESCRLESGEKVFEKTGPNIFAHIGFHWTTPWRGKGSGWFNYVGFYVPLIDLGGLVNPHTGSDVETQPNVGFKQVFSPGIYLTSNVRGPVLVGFGASRASELLKSKSGANVTPTVVQLFIALDLTLLPF